MPARGVSLLSPRAALLFMQKPELVSGFFLFRGCAVAPFWRADGGGASFRRLPGRSGARGPLLSAGCCLVLMLPHLFAAAATFALAQLGQDAAVGRPAAGAGMQQRGKMFAQMRERGNLRIHIGQMLLHQGRDPVTTLPWMILEGKELAYFVKRHTVETALSDKAQAFDIRFVIQAVVARRARG